MAEVRDENMIEIKEIKIPVTAKDNRLAQQIARRLHLKEAPEYRILRRSIDARKKPDIYYVYTVGVTLSGEEEIVDKLNDKNIMLTNRVSYEIPSPGQMEIQHHPLVIGAGPAGLFCGLLLAKQGYVPVIVERGHSVTERAAQVEAFFAGKPLDEECNVQFGEGGAGAFSDGKLNTQVKDKSGRIPYVLETFVRHGAPEEILYDYRPHVGTDRLLKVVQGLHEEIEAAGGVFLFDTKAVDIRIEDNRVTAVKLSHRGFDTWVKSNHVIFATGHSARDTVSMLYGHDIPMHGKDFAMGVRVEHPAAWIQQAMYGTGEAARLLPPASYKLACQTKEGRGVYSFCMCPGGYVINASSEEGGIAVNGMSYSGRDGANSNSAIVVTVKQSDFGSDAPLAGVEMQRKLERAAYQAGKGKAPVQRFADFCKGIPTTAFGAVTPQIKGGYAMGNVAECLPDFLRDAIIEGMQTFETSIPGFANEDVLVSGVESRTSSPVRIERDEGYMTRIAGIYPCGEGAGYAGGILSAAVDGMKVAEAVIRRYQPKK